MLFSFSEKKLNINRLDEDICSIALTVKTSTTSFKEFAHKTKTGAYATKVDMFRRITKYQHNFSYLLILRAYNLTIFTCHVNYHRILLH